MNLNITLEHISSELIKELISKDSKSHAKAVMHDADKYFNVENSVISERKKMMMLYDKDDMPYVKPDLSKANHKIRHSYLQELINQCTNYLAGKPIKIDYKKAFERIGKEDKKEVETETKEMQEEGALSKADMDKELIDNELFKNNNFLSFLQDNIMNVQLYGKSYMRIVKHNEHIKFVTYDPKEIIMFYDDFDQPVLALRYYSKPEVVSTERKGKAPKIEIKEVVYVEVFDKANKQVWKETKDGFELVDTEPLYSKKIVYGDTVEVSETIEMDIFPIIEWKFNSQTIPTLTNIKDFIDLQDMNISDLANNVEDIQEAIWILENYNGQNLKEFMEDLKVKKAIKVGQGGNARTETIQIPTEARTKLYDVCTKNIYKFGFGINFSERDSLGNVSGVSLKWSYAPLEQKANSIENNGQSALNKLFNILFKLMELPYDSNDLEFIFDRTMISNEQEQTATIMSASSQLSQKTILDNLPMVVDTEEEIERLEEQNEYEPILPKETFEDGEEDEEDAHERDEDALVVPNSKSN